MMTEETKPDVGVPMKNTIKEIVKDIIENLNEDWYIISGLVPEVRSNLYTTALGCLFEITMSCGIRIIH